MPLHQPPVSPPAPVTAVPIGDTGSGGGFVVFFIAFVLVFALVTAFLIYAVVKTFGGGSSTTESFSETGPRLVDDGFWFDTRGYRAGQVVPYTYRDHGGMVSREFVVEPSDQGQFIYTGRRPADLAIGSLIAAEVIRETQKPSRPEPRPARNDDDDIRRYPSAY
jgi:hypothetical protein